ncbi:L-serine ammonia-lyase, iron-sulfur-dependent, subunit alpha [Geosporobacter ferrireducens]|uniref:L-serine dehydratase n=1 Tax=Geosporobacter ferrireducens TaxID=1424294 RepID=A0A1D8GPA7_9FIRM|nr:L-serine ammonia-lyase, iron-sulfur-dependent, subunit alpha [Geosporobacter ferrireducens]AOT72781.1 L-serine dehydratase, iron-sulfur-dependent subunit alpha [Geosporobacter ferrireducens]MTI55197.1 L-serine ammonia-lyase, iron-sulfur-dependent, subunit alpha [Geosporobacter ferrireducens]
MDFEFNNGRECIDLCNQNNKKIWEVMLEREAAITGKEKNEIIHYMMDNLQIMKNAVRKGLYEDVKSVSGLVGGDAKKLRERYENHKTLSGYRMNKAVASAMAVLEVNAAMGQIVAAPTAGSSGILPGVLITVAESFELSDEETVRGLITASAIGYIITRNATVAGAEGGCQAETGAAAAMAAAAAVELMGGSPEQAFHAAAITIKNIMGLVCDPIAGLVEAPCVKRNAIGTANALISADIALAGIESIIPFDEVVEAMYRVGRMMPCELRETALGGLAATPTGLEIQKRIFGEQK